MVDICAESGVGAHIDGATLCWAYDLDFWGLCGQGSDEASAHDDLRRRALPAFRAFVARHGEAAAEPIALEVVERIHSDEQAFLKDHEPATEAEVARTLALLNWAREDLRALLATASDAERRWDDPERVLPTWARWRTLDDMAWHIADTESRYYLSSLGVAAPERAASLADELDRSHAHVAAVLPTLDRDRVVEYAGETWTTRKLLRRLAWHERSELDAMREMLDRVRAVRTGWQP